MLVTVFQLKIDLDTKTRRSVRDPFTDEMAALCKQEKPNDPKDPHGRERQVKMDELCEQARIVAARDLLTSGAYNKVAIMNCDSLGEVYSALQNHDDSWSLDGRDGLVVFEPYGIEHEGKLFGRGSLQTGDVLQVGDTFHVVGRAYGFPEIGQVEFDTVPSETAPTVSEA